MLDIYIFDLGNFISVFIVEIIPLTSYFLYFFDSTDQSTQPKPIKVWACTRAAPPLRLMLEASSTADTLLLIVDSSDPNNSICKKVCTAK